MMQRPIPTFTRSLPAIVLLLLSLLTGCEPETLKQEVSPDQQANARSAACNAFSYADTLFYYRDNTNYTVSPTRAQAGRYGAFPGGMVINQTTGAIDVNASESGLKYRVWFVKSGTRDTCSRFVTISGINYFNKVYRVNQNDTLSRPFYNGVGTLAPPCTSTNGKEADGCEYDNFGKQIATEGIVIDKKTGVINLAKTIKSGAFGQTPINGSTKTVRLYYRLNDASKKALNYIDINFHWYASYGQIPASLLTRVKDKSAATLRRAATSPLTPGLPTNYSTDVKRPRPPDIVLVGHYEE